MSPSSHPGGKRPATHRNDSSLEPSNRNMDRNKGNTRPSQHRAMTDKPYVDEKATYKPTKDDNKHQESRLDSRHSQSKGSGHILVKEPRHSPADGLSEKKKLFDPRHPPAIDRYLEERSLEAARLRGEREMANFLDKWEGKWSKCKTKKGRYRGGLASPYLRCID